MCSSRLNKVKLHGLKMNNVRVMRIHGIGAETAAENDRDQLVGVEAGAEDDRVAKQVDPLGHTPTFSLG